MNRNRVYAYIKEHQVAEASELSENLGLSYRSVCACIKMLVKEGKIRKARREDDFGTYTFVEIKRN